LYTFKDLHEKVTNKLLIVSAVTNDLVTDARVKRIANELKRYAGKVILVGRKFKDSKSISEEGFSIVRFRLLFTKGPLFYASFNIRLFLWLTKTWPDVVIANDTDTLIACYTFSRLFHKKLIFDSHELFSEVPEIQE
jgi:hypothetical protein